MEVCLELLAGSLIRSMQIKQALPHVIFKAQSTWQKKKEKKEFNLNDLKVLPNESL
jgi:hypothetical protein